MVKPVKPAATRGAGHHEDEDQELPAELEPSQQVDVTDVRSLKKTTRPPKRFTEATTSQFYNPLRGGWK